MKEVAKQIEWQKPNITEPFVSTSNPIRITGPSQRRSQIMQKYANMQFTGQFDRDAFMDQLSDVLLREGTVWTCSKWDYQEDLVKEQYDNISAERLISIGDTPSTFEENPDGTFNVTYEKVKRKKNQPTGEIARNENVFPDPSARTREEMDFIMVRRYETVESMKASGNYSDAILARLQGSNETNTESSLASQRNRDDLTYGYDSAHMKANSKKIAIIEYWGTADLNNDGKPVPIVAEWAEKEEIYLMIDENPMPDKEIPYEVAVYSSRPFSIWGNGLAFFLGDSQEIKSGMMRGMMDNLSNANNGQTFAMRGSMDYVNFKRWRNGERHVIVNKHPAESMYQGNFNNLPPSIFNALQMVDGEIERLSGTQVSGPALSNSNTAKDDTGNQQLTMAQQRMSAVVRTVASLISKMIKKWVICAEHWLDDDQIEMMFTDSEAVDINAFRDSGETIVKMKVGTEVTRNMQIQQLNLLMQQSKILDSTLPPQELNKIVAEMYELFDKYEDAEEIRNYTPPPPSEEELKLNNLKMEAIELENAKVQAEIDKLKAEAQNFMADAQATIMYKQAQTAEKLAKAEGQNVDTALKPTQQMVEIEKAKPKENTQQG